MLSWAIGFLILAIIAAILGFTGLLIFTAAVIAKWIFVFFIVLFIVALIAHFARGGHGGAG